MKILVTGASGFIGTRLVRHLRETGHTVYCHDYEQGDISRADALQTYPVVDHVFHLAGRVFVPASWEETHGFYRVNIMGTVTVLEYCRTKKCSLTYISTYVYGEPQAVPIVEAHPLKAVSPYHQSKLIGEELVAFYSSIFGVKAAVLRPFNIYGPGQNKQFLIPKVLDQLLDKGATSINVFNLEPRRDYIYIDDVVAAMTATLQQMSHYDVYNVGCGISYSVADVIETCMKVTGIVKPYQGEKRIREGEINDCRADISKITKELGFHPRVSLEMGIGMMVDESNEDH